ncbi:MAG: hypothetical protein HN411_05610 [Waddliaceae bacterium]|jgi:hypothetical protein|nr:hypothetical protein [Waddliaceae bacterium]MBT3578368.1 hypothetical protein [Waddliaceae bacterium]MBT4445555.1 hypothetical protein [Waddliaceae bacterium]MBT6929103.1 hypothetical protein [Waddliaceae bacterium]MBT7264407.1 hypothetical protein [Waddliaceae bacterium]
MTGPVSRDLGDINIVHALRIDDPDVVAISTDDDGTERRTLTDLMIKNLTPTNANQQRLLGTTERLKFYETRTIYSIAYGFVGALITFFAFYVLLEDNRPKKPVKIAFIAGALFLLPLFFLNHFKKHAGLLKKQKERLETCIRHYRAKESAVITDGKIQALCDRITIAQYTLELFLDRVAYDLVYNNAVPPHPETSEVPTDPDFGAVENIV